MKIRVSVYIIYPVPGNGSPPSLGKKETALIFLYSSQSTAEFMDVSSENITQLNDNK